MDDQSPKDLSPKEKYHQSINLLASNLKSENLCDESSIAISNLPDMNAEMLDYTKNIKTITGHLRKTLKYNNIYTNR